MMMGTQRLYKCFVTGGFFLAMSMAGLANDNKPYHITASFGNMGIAPVADTIPPQETKKADERTSNTPAEIIKEVPKSRKQVKPLAITTAAAIKPVVVKPKIIVKPIIKLH